MNAAELSLIREPYLMALMTLTNPTIDSNDRNLNFKERRVPIVGLR